MTALARSDRHVMMPGEDHILTGEVLAHLDAQLVAARRLLAIVLEQGAAIRVRDVHAVVAGTGLMQAELQRRDLVERERTRLLQVAGARLAINPGAVTIEHLCALMDPATADLARVRSAELRGLLTEIRQEHHTNRALMQQELAFLDHLLRIAEVDNIAGYAADGDLARPSGPRLAPRHRVLDLEV
jgi:FlgN protein